MKEDWSRSDYLKLVKSRFRVTALQDINIGKWTTGLR